MQYYVVGFLTGMVVTLLIGVLYKIALSYIHYKEIQVFVGDMIKESRKVKKDNEEFDRMMRNG